MSRRQRANGDHIAGPTSALTSFLKEKGIVAPARRPVREQNQPTPPPASTSSTPAPAPVQVTLEDDEDDQPIAGPSSSKRKKALESDEDELEEPEASTSKAKPKKKMTATEMKKKKKQAADEADLQLKEFSGANKPVKGRYVNRTPGAFVYCAECGSKFTYTKYTPNSADGKGVYCPPCQKENNVPNEGGSGAATPKKKARAVKPKPQPVEKPKPIIKSLQSCCIQLIGQHIEVVEELGDVGHANLDKICKIVCKNRALNESTMKLFLDVNSSQLALYDCARLEVEDYEQLATFAPKLKHLTLNFCGGLVDSVIECFGQNLTKLTRLELYGCFLIKAPQWQSYFDSFLAADRDPLEGFLIRQSPRFDESCVLRLVENFPNLTELRLAEIQKLDDSCLKLLMPLTFLTLLDLTRAGLNGQNITDDGVIPLLEHVGQNLVTLVLNNNEMLTDRVLVEGIRPHCPNLRNLGLRELPELMPEGSAGLFKDWEENDGLETIDISRCIELDDNVIVLMLEHSGATLKELNMNSVDKGVTEVGVKKIAEKCSALRVLDIGFCRALDDFTMKDILDKCTLLEKLSVFGCNRVTDHAPTKSGVKILGESTTKIEFY